MGQLGQASKPLNAVGWMGMFRALFAICLCCWLGSCASPKADSCATRAEVMLDLSFHAFDQGPGGWRSLDASFACSAHADDALAAYRARHASDLSAANTSLLMWHEAQVLAGQGDTERAVSLMKEAAWVGEPEWQRLYREGSIAFLERDLARLTARRESLAQLPRDPGLTTSDGTEATWPPNLEVLDGFIACFGKPYDTAYACRPPPLSF